MAAATERPPSKTKRGNPKATKSSRGSDRRPERSSAADDYMFEEPAPYWEEPGENETAGESDEELDSRADPEFASGSAGSRREARGERLFQQAAGRSLKLSSLIASEYCSENLMNLLSSAARRSDATFAGSRLVSLDDVAGAIFSDNPASPFMKDWRKAILGPTASPAEPSPAPASNNTDDPSKVILRWDVVEVLAEAARIRERLSPGSRGRIRSPAFALALLRTASGQTSLANLKLIDGSIDHVAKQTRFLLERVDFGANSPARAEIFAELDKQVLLVAQEQAEVSFDADRAQRPLIDSLGFRQDAEALANLILLEAARPPLAIGLFGPWGSGKSTMMREIQHCIHVETEKERRLAKHGARDRNPETRRVSKVAQIEFNAWAYADSANLWASLTSEFFDQLAAGGLKPGENRGDGQFQELVDEVIARSSREAAALRSADDQAAALRRRIEIQEKEVREAEDSLKIAAASAAAQVVLDLGFKADDKTDSNPDSPTTTQPTPKEQGALRIFDKVTGGAEPGQKIAAYANAGSDIARWFKIIIDYGRAYVRSHPVRTLAGVALVIGGAIALWLFARSIDLSRSSSLLLSLVPVVSGLATLFGALLPAIRVAALFRRHLHEERAAAETAEANAKAALASLTSDLEATEAQRQSSQKLVDKYKGLAHEPNAASPTLMLEYLMRDSLEVEKLRGQLGVVAIVRRCFEQLDAVLKHKAVDADSIDRIILYIDDLDRCTPEQVTQVLQAVHLLLAFECFVVIVAVDARWLKQSLEKSQAQLDKKNGESPVSAADYLEKIFQIAFWVRPLVDHDAEPSVRYEGYSKLVRALATGQKAISTTPSTASTTADAPVGTTADTSRFEWTQPERLDQAEAVRRRGIELTDDEVSFMEAMAPLAAKSPRAVKRMINLYRLIRIGYRGEQLSQFLSRGGPGVPTYRELLLALAWETGLSAESRIRLRNDIMSTTARASWVPTSLLNSVNNVDKPAFEAIAQHLYGATKTGLFTAIEEVRRYSFSDWC